MLGAPWTPGADGELDVRCDMDSEADIWRGRAGDEEAMAGEEAIWRGRAGEEAMAGNEEAMVTVSALPIVDGGDVVNRW